MNTNYFLQCSLFINFCEYNNISFNLQHYLYNDYLYHLCLTSPIKHNCIFCTDFFFNSSFYNILYFYNITYSECQILYNNFNSSCSLHKWISFCNSKFSFNSYYFLFYFTFLCFFIFIYYIFYSIISYYI